MKTKIKKKLEIVITLSIEEALWIKRVVQNQLQKKESDEEYSIRSNIWDALPSYEEFDKWQQE